MTYNFPVEFDVGSVLPSVKEITDTVNDSMSAFGFNEKMSIRGELLQMIVNTPRELTDEENETIREAAQTTITEAFPQYQVKVGKGLLQ